MIFLDGFLTGLILQIAIGPIFFYILNLALARSLLDAYVAMGATLLVDYLYITLAILGVGKAMETQRIKRILGLVGAVVLGGFGWMMILGAGSGSPVIRIVSESPNPLSSFFSTFILAISSPLTIVFWTGVFAAKAVEKDYSRRELIPFGIAAGLATLVFLGISITALYSVKSTLSGIFIRYLNGAVGVILIIYGVARIVKLILDGTNGDQAS